jgi:putative ABC transport system substrate-binding protein
MLLRQMKKHSIRLISFAVVLLTVVAAAQCKPVKPKKYTIGIINTNPQLEAVVAGFKSGLSKFGYIEGKNVEYVYKMTPPDPDQIDAALREVLSGKSDMLFACTGPVARRAKKLAAETVPIVFAPVYYPVKSGLVESLSRPGPNITGIQIGGSAANALQWLLEIDPRVKRIYVPFDTTQDVAAKYSLEDLEEGAGKLGVELVVSKVSTVKKLVAALDVHAVWLLNSPLLVSNVTEYVKAANRRRLPTASSTSQSRAGILITYGQESMRTGEQASFLAHKILSGARPSDLPVETSDFFLGINLQTAKAVGLEIPESILQQAHFLTR